MKLVRLFSFSAAILLFADYGFAQHEAAVVYKAGEQVLVIQAGKIAGVNPAELPLFAEVVDFGPDAVFAPGLVAADSSWTGSGGQGDHALGAHRRAFDSFDLWDDMTEALERGITTVYLSPDRSRLIGGRGAVVKTAGESRVLRALGDLRVSLHGEALSPPDFYRPPIPPTTENPLLPAQVQPATTRAGALLALRQSGSAALVGGGEFDPHLSAFGSFLAEKGTLRVSTAEQEGLEAALGLSELWGLPLLVEVGPRGASFPELGLGGGLFSWGDALLKRLAVERARVIFRVPLRLGFGGSGEGEFDPDVLRRLYEASVPLAVVPGRQGSWTWLLEAASAAVGFGLPETSALSSITADAADALEVGHRVGSLEVGKDADFLVMDGPPLDAATSVRKVYVDGELAWSRDLDFDSGTIVRGGTLWTGDGPPISGGVEVLLRGGKVVAAGHRVPHPLGARLVDTGSATHLTPGFIDSRGFLGIGTGRIDVSTPLGRTAAGSFFKKSWRQVARGGVTTMVVGPSRIPSEGARARAVKTAATLPEDAWIQGRSVVFFDLRGGDRADREAKLKRTLDKGEKYAEQWQKHREERAKWEEDEAEKKEREAADSEAELRGRLAGEGVVETAEEEVEETERAEEEVPEEPKVVDKLNGLWEAVIEHEMLPEPITVNAQLHHDGEVLTALFSSPDDPSGEVAELEGTWKDPEARFEVPTEMGPVIGTGTVDAPDHMNCHVEFGPIGAVDFEAVRIEIEEEGAAPVRRKKKSDEGPQPPSTDSKLEGMRDLFEGRGVAVVAANRADEIRLALKAFASREIPVHILGGEDAVHLADELIATDSGVVVSTQLVDRDEAGHLFVPSAKLFEVGVVSSFQSGSQGGARWMASVLAMAARHGLGIEQALASLTSGAARMLGLESRVGRLAPGLDGDLLVHNGPPLDLRTNIIRVFVNGTEVPED